MRWEFPLVALVACVVVVNVHAVSTATMLSAISSQAGAFTNIFGGAIVTEKTTATTTAGTPRAIGYGARNPTTGDAFLPDTPLRANTGLGEASVAVLVQTLITSQILPQLDSSVPTRFFPGGVQMLNPSFPGVPLTLRMLMTHTSSILDNGALFTSPTTSGTGVAQTSLRTYAESYFLTSGSSGTSSVATDIWSSLQPGLTSTYQYARANIVLLSYILEQVIAENPTLVTSSQKTVGAYIQESVFAALGMTDTFFVLPDGSYPMTSTGFNVFGVRVAAETSASGVVVTTVPLYAGYTADVMIRTSANDVHKLMRALFLDSTSAFYTIGQAMIASLTTVTDSVRTGVIKQGFGIVGFSPSLLCSSAGSVLTLTAGCSVSSSTLYGITGVGTTSSVVAVCTANIDTSAGSTCTTSVFSYNPSAAMSLSSTGFVAAAAAFNDQFIDSAVTEGTTITPDGQTPEAIYGFYVFLGVIGSAVGVLFMAYVGEYVLRPVPLLGPQANHAYPTLTEHIDKTNRSMRQQQRQMFR
ncbi:beta lactamase-like protein, putative [Bodo saltans]|uniref:Beta lactamase-like protein, putative n=1 Tax=Bodo saltans TaxID=75058 RepID=A0A0S4KHC6_BODSA|nr:beta lactamase-like protein, putative [Bodo saltans]|eukprot:CUI12359.1 beta lactamase-like protein, putative [Bodo saltans]